MHKMRKIMAIILLLMLVPGQISCSPVEEGGVLRRIDAPADFLIEGERHGVGFSAAVSLGEGEGKMIFISPASLEGICISTAGGVWNCVAEDIAVAGIAAELLGAPLAVFASLGEARSAEKLTDGEGRALTLIVTASARGSVEYYIDSKSGYPVSVTEKDPAGATVMQFNITEYTSR
jgi:hypothetical protein